MAQGTRVWRIGAMLLVSVPVWLGAQQGRGANPFPGGTNPDGSLRPSAPVTRLFTQDAYTEYALLEPGSESFRIRFLPEETRVGATELVNATRGGSEGSGDRGLRSAHRQAARVHVRAAGRTIRRATRFARSCRGPCPKAASAAC